MMNGSGHLHVDSTVGYHIFETTVSGTVDPNSFWNTCYSYRPRGFHNRNALNFS